MRGIDDQIKNAGLFVKIELRDLPDDMQPIVDALITDFQRMLGVLEHYTPPSADEFTEDLIIYASGGVAKILKGLPIVEIEELLKAARTATPEEVADIFATQGIDTDVIVEILKLFPRLMKDVNITLTEAVGKIVQAGSLEASRHALEGTSRELAVMSRDTNRAVCVTVDTRRTPERNVGELIFVLYYVVCELMTKVRNNAGVRKDISEDIPELANLAPAIADIFSLLVLQSILGAGLLPAIKDLLDKLDVESLGAKFNDLLVKLHAYKCTPNSKLTESHRRLLINTYQGHLNNLAQIKVVRKSL